MEEIYKPETEDAGKVEVYSRENNEMLGDMPQWLIHTGSYIVYGLIVFLVAGTALFKYPDTIKKAVTIDDMGSVEWITANQGGMIERFFIENQSQVKRNDTLGILKNTASLEDVQTFCNVLTNIEWYYRTNDIKLSARLSVQSDYGGNGSGIRAIHPSGTYLCHVSGIRLVSAEKEVPG